jgi:hypothetical protein
MSPKDRALLWIAVAVELESLDVVFGTSSSSNSETLVGLHILDLINTSAGHIGYRPTARRVAVAVELESLDVVFGTSENSHCL